MNRNCLFNKAIALLLCAVMLVGFLPSVAFGAAADEWKPDDNEGPLDVFETTEAPTEPVGSKGNPEAISKSATATLAADSDGYYYVYKNESSGTLNINFNGDYGYKFTVSKNGEVVASGMDANNFAYNYTLPEWPESNVNGYAYEAGTELIIWVNTYNVATIETTNEDGSVASTEYEEQYPEGSVTVTVEFTYPEGTQQNPITLWADEDNSAVIEAGATKYFEYCVSGNGYLTVAFEGEGAVCVLSVDGVAQDSSAVNNVKYTSGQVYAFAVSAEAETNVNFVVTFVNGWGDETSPFLMTKMDFTVTIPAGETYWYQGNLTGMNLTVTGEQGVLTYNSAQSEITSDGTTVMITTGDFFNKPMFAVGNDAESAVTYHIVVAYPAGHYTNPDKAVLGDNSVTLATPSDQGYYFDYVAEKDGDLIFTITSESNWSYNVSVGSYVEYGFDASIYGENRLYAEDPAVKTLTLPVTAGQIVQIVVNAVEAEQVSHTWEGVTEYSYNTTPIAGTVSFNLAYKEEEHVHSWGDWETVTAADNTKCGEAKRECTLCGAEETKVIPVVLKLRWASLELVSSVTIKFETSKEVFECYDDLYVVFNFMGEDITVPAGDVLNGKDRVEFLFQGVAANWMSETVVATLYGTFEGELYAQASPTEYSVQKYVSSRWNKADCTDAEKKTLANLLNYGAAAQNQTGHKLDNLANSILNSDMQAYATTTPASGMNLFDYQNAKYETVENAKISMKSVSLMLDSAVVFRLKFVINDSSDISNYTVKITSARDTWEFGSEYFTYSASEGRWVFEFSELFANEMRSLFYVTFYEGDTKVSNTLRYNIQTYVARNYTDTPVDADEAKESAMILAMLRYGDSVAAMSPPVSQD